MVNVHVVYVVLWTNYSIQGDFDKHILLHLSIDFLNQTLFLVFFEFFLQVNEAKFVLIDENFSPEKWIQVQ